MCEKVLIHQLISPTPRGKGNCHYNLLTLGKSVESSACVFSIFKKRKEKNAIPVKLNAIYKKTIDPTEPSECSLYPSHDCLFTRSFSNSASSFIPP